jgi:uncharacterized protein with FMN-binding domain
MKRKNACFTLSLLFWASMAYAQVTGTGTENSIPLWLGTTNLGSSGIVQSGGNVGIGTKTPDSRLQVVTQSTTTAAITGNANATSGYASGVYGTTASTTTYAAAVYVTQQRRRVLHLEFTASLTRPMERPSKVTPLPVMPERVLVSLDTQITAGLEYLAMQAPRRT